MQKVSRLRKLLDFSTLPEVSKSFFVPCFPVSQTKFQLYFHSAKNITNGF